MNTQCPTCGLNQSTQGDVVGTLLEAATAARTTTTYEAPSNWPPPEPGTHECDLGCLGGPHIGVFNSVGLRAGGIDECEAAAEWSRANRKDDWTDIDLEPAIGRNFDYIARPKENK